MGKFVCNVIWAVTGIVIGVSAGIAFGPVLNNPDASIFGFFSAVVAAVLLAVHIMYAKNFWTSDSYFSLLCLQYCGCFIQLLGYTGMVVYLVLGVDNNQNFEVLTGRLHYLTAVWCFMTWKWGFMLFYHCRKYRCQLLKPDVYAEIQES